MFTPGGQLDLHTFAGMRGGGKGGGGGSDNRFESKPIVLTDPVNGKTFTEETNPYLRYMQPNNGVGSSAQDRLNAEIAQRQAEEKAASDQAKAAADAKAQQAEGTFQTTRGNAYNDAMQAAIRAFSGQGVDPNTYMSNYITPTLQRQFNSIQDLDPNPYAAFPTSLGDTIVNQATSDRRTQLLNQLNSTFTPTYASTALPDTLTGQYAGSIVDEQFNPLMDQLGNAQKRGTLTDRGYTAALDALNQKKSAALSSVTNLGQGILSTDRSALDDYIRGARSDINSATLGANIDPSSYFGGAQSKAQGFTSDFSGALRNAVGGTKFADIQDLINAGGAVQGANNPTAANPAGGPGGTAPAFQPDDVLANQKRGLGNQGAF
jgi:hypothetical protein